MVSLVPSSSGYIKSTNCLNKTTACGTLAASYARNCNTNQRKRSKNTCRVYFRTQTGCVGGERGSGRGLTIGRVASAA